MWFVSSRKYIMFLEGVWPKTALKRIYKEVTPQNFNRAEERKI